MKGTQPDERLLTADWCLPQALPFLRGKAQVLVCLSKATMGLGTSLRHLFLVLHHPGSCPGPMEDSDPLGSPLREIKGVGGTCTYQPSSWLLTGWRGQPIGWQNVSGEGRKSLSCPGCCDGCQSPALQSWSSDCPELSVDLASGLLLVPHPQC